MCDYSSAAGIDAEALPEDLDIHHLIVNSWADLEAPQNVCIASIPTVFNASLAPPGKAVVHAYTAGNEPYSLWEGQDTRSQEYQQLKVVFRIFSGAVTSYSQIPVLMAYSPWTSICNAGTEQCHHFLSLVTLWTAQ